MTRYLLSNFQRILPWIEIIMPVLVSYGDSDEDSDESSKPTRNHVSGAESNCKDDTLTRSSEAVGAQNDVSGPVLGPTIPADIDQGVLSYEEDLAEPLPDLPEQDLLRYLTQPAHPAAQIPPEPSTAANPAVTARFKHFLQLKSKGIHFNQDLAGKASFKNPNLFASLLERTGLPPDAQYKSTVPTAIFDPSSLPSWSYKDELLRSQQAHIAELNATKKTQSANGKRVIDFTPAGHEATQTSLKRPHE